MNITQLQELTEKAKKATELERLKLQNRNNEKELKRIAEGNFGEDFVEWFCELIPYAPEGFDQIHTIESIVCTSKSKKKIILL